MIYYDFPNFQPEILRRSSAILFIWVMGSADRPLEFFLLLCGVPGRDFWNRESSGSSIPVMGCFLVARKRWGSMRDTRATFGWARLKPGWPEEGRRQLGLVTAAMFRHVEGRRGSVSWSRSFFKVMWSCWSDQRGVGVAGRPSRRGGRSGGGEDRWRTSVGRSGEGFAPGWDRGASCTVGKLTAGSIGAEEGRVGVFHSR
jgi:hypothetical protein